MFYLPLSFSFFIFLLLHNFIIFLPQFFYSLLHNFTILIFSLHHHHHHHRRRHISIVFPPTPPPPPPPPHFYYFPSTTTTTTTTTTATKFLLFSLHHHHRHHISIVFPPPPPQKPAKNNRKLLILCIQWKKTVKNITSWQKNSVSFSCQILFKFSAWTHLSNFDQSVGPVVRTPVSANPGLNFNTGFFYLVIKSTFSDNFLYSF